MEEKGTVLLVDDSAGDRALFRKILTRGGYRVFDIGCGAETLQKAHEVRPHVIVLDVNLPDLNGLDVCRAIRSDRLVGSVPVLMLTVRHDDDDVVAGLEAGADDYVAKDSAPPLVLARVQRLVQYRLMVSQTMLNRQLVQVGRLLAGIIHEIRGPLSVIRGSAELLRLNFDPDHPDAQWLDSILRGTHLLQVRVDHLMSTVRAGPAHREAIDIETLVAEAIELFVKGLPLSGRGIHIDQACNERLLVNVDAGRMIQVLIDLLSNAHQAIHGAGEGGRITVSTELRTVDDAPWVDLKVIDDGPGIPESYLHRIFEPFFTTKESGTGYGLYLASEIICEQGGQIAVCNNPAGGACLTISLPVAIPAQPAPSSISPEHALPPSES